MSVEPKASAEESTDFENENLNLNMVNTWLKKFLNGPASFWDLFSSYLAQSSYLVRNIDVNDRGHRLRITHTQGAFGVAFERTLTNTVALHNASRIT